MSWTVAPAEQVPGGGQQRALLLGCALLAGFKLWLVAGDELVARANPLDQLRYLEMARSLTLGHWLGAYDHLTLIREPGYPAWVALVHQLGFPLRLATEGLLIAAAVLFAAALLRAGTSWLAALACCAVIALEPHSLAVNRDALPAGFYFPVLLCALAGLVWSALAARPRWTALHAGWSGLALGVLWITRPEKAFALVPVAVIAAFDLAAGRWRGASWRLALRRAAVLAGVPLCGIAIVAGGVAAINQRQYGVFATTDVTGPGYLAANRALLSIEHAAPRRFVPVPRDVRQRAYRVSAAFRELRPTLEGSSWARAVSCHIDRVCDDIGAGYFRWLLRDAAAAAGHMASPAQADAFFQRIADDLEAACRSGALRCRWTPTTFLHPYPETYVSHLWGSLRRVLRTAFSAGGRQFWDAPGDAPGTPPRVRNLFDEMANRRADRTGSGGQEDGLRRAVRVALWAAHPFFYAAVSALGLLAAGALLLPFRRDRFADLVFGVFLTLAALVALRFAMLALVDASSFPARSSRYVYPAVSLYGCAVLLLIEQGVRNLMQRASGKGWRRVG
jgi:hypothetical protein